MASLPIPFRSQQTVRNHRRRFLRPVAYREHQPPRPPQVQIQHAPVSSRPILHVLAFGGIPPFAAIAAAIRSTGMSVSPSLRHVLQRPLLTSISPTHTVRQQYEHDRTSSLHVVRLQTSHGTVDPSGEKSTVDVARRSMPFAREGATLVDHGRKVRSAVPVAVHGADGGVLTTRQGRRTRRTPLPCIRARLLASRPRSDGYDEATFPRGDRCPIRPSPANMGAPHADHRRGSRRDRP
jgi:hypothetical protein